jgi:hypothetical protein
MTLLRLLNAQGIAGIAVAVCLALLLMIQKAETTHWKKQSAEFEQQSRNDQIAFATTVANYRNAASAAVAADKANAERGAAEQQSINERTAHDYEARLAAARARADQLRVQHQSAAAHPGNGTAAAVPGLSAASGGPAEAARKDGLPAGDALTATEQAIQLDELIKWIQRQHEVDPSDNSSR